MKKLLTILAVLTAIAFTSDVTAASKHTTSSWMNFELHGIATDLFAPLSKYAADLEGDLNTHFVGSFACVEFVPKNVLLSGASEFDCELGRITTCDEVVLLPICEPCIYMWVGIHYIHDAASRDLVNGTLYSLGTVMLDRDGMWHLDINYVGFVVVREQVPVEGPGFGVD